MSRVFLLHGAIKNAGDFLIRERGRALVTHVLPARTIVEQGRQQPLDTSELRPEDLVLLCGGPGYRPDFYPGVFPLAAPVESIPCTVAPLGLGLGVGFQANALDTFRFTPQSLHALEWMHRSLPTSSARDVVTAEVLRDRAGVDAKPLGCPSWFHLPDLDKPFVAPTRIGRVVVTTPAALALTGQCLALLRLVARRYRASERHLVFHRGILPDRHTGVRTAAANLVIAAAATALGFVVHDAAYGVHGIAFYQDCDLHIGYRVHAHLDFLSRRKPSVLLCEDVRGAGQSLTLGTNDVMADTPNTIEDVESRLNHHERTQFADFGVTVERMRDGYASTVQYLRAL